MVAISRTAIRGRLPAVLLVAGALLAACAPKPKQLSTTQFEAIQRQLAAQSSDVATEPAGGVATPAVGPSPVPPRSDAERRARAEKALPPGVDLGTLAAAGDGRRWVMALATGRRDGTTVGPHLLLLDVSAPDGVLLGEHDFGLEQSDAAPPSRLARALLLDDASAEEPVVLGELFLPEGARDPLFGVCGWWLRRRRAAFLCAPRLTPTSRYDEHDGQLVETWSVEPLGGDAGAGRRSGRQLRFVDGQWQESDSFRCLGVPLEQAFKEAGRQPLAKWQQDTVQRLTRAAARASEALETDVALSRLRDALATDGCATDTWRLLGRLEFEAGRPRAAATLAVALALAPRDDAVLVDLADSVAVLRTDVTAQRDTWHDVVGVLGSRNATRTLLADGADKSPRDLARALYRTFLERTAGGGELLAARRRRVEDKLAALDARKRN